MKTEQLSKKPVLSRGALVSMMSSVGVTCANGDACGVSVGVDIALEDGVGNGDAFVTVDVGLGLAKIAGALTVSVADPKFAETPDMNPPP